MPATSAFDAALAFHEAGDAILAMREYRNAIRTTPQHAPAAYSNLGVLVGQQPGGGSHRRDEQLHYSAAAAKLAPRNGQIVYNLANAYMEHSRDAEAAHAYKRVLSLGQRGPAHAPSYHNLALLAHRRGASDEALSHFRSTLACTPDELAQVGGATQVYANMAAAGLSVGDAAMAGEALAAQRAAVAKDPTDAVALVRLAERLMDDKTLSGARAAEAEAALRGALKLQGGEKPQPSSQPPQPSSRLHALNLLGTLLQAQPGRFAEAASAYRAALGTGGAGVDAYHNLGTIHQRLGQHSEAKALYDVALKLGPSTPNVYVSLASLAPPAESIQLLKSAIALKPNDAQNYVRLAAAIAPKPLGGAASPSESDLRKAMTAMSHAVKLSPQEAASHAELGRLRVALAALLLEEGSASLDRAAELQPTSAEALNAAALLHRTLGRSAGATSKFDKGVALTRQHAAAAALVNAHSGGNNNKDKGNGTLAGGVVDWNGVSHSLTSFGYAIVDGVLGGGVALTLSREIGKLHPLMRRGRVGVGLESDAVRTDYLWRHRRGEGTIIDSTAPHMAALHALFDALPLGLNRLRYYSVDAEEEEEGEVCTSATASSASSSSSSCREQTAPSLRPPPSSWALTHAEDLQFACYHPGGYYRKHSDAQNASRRVLTAIYYPNHKWRASDGGRLRMYTTSTAGTAWPAGGAAAAGAGRRGGQSDSGSSEEGHHVDIDPRADRLVIFDSRLDHEVLPLLEAKRAKKAKKRAKEAPSSPPEPRCAFTQWFQDLAPPLLASPVLEYRSQP